MHEVPAWSGSIWVSADGENAYCTIHNDDERMPNPPTGFVLREVIDDGDSETWVFDRA